MSYNIAIIPARSGSKGIPGKNIKALSGHPLISYSIVSAKLAGVDRVIVSTDSAEYAQVAQHYGADVPFLRPKDISGDQSTDYQFMYHAMNWILKNEKEVPKYWLHLRPTTPLRDPNVLKDAMHLIETKPGAISLRSGHAATESPFKWLMRDSSGYFVGLREDLTPEKVNLPRQTFPPVYIPNGYIDIVRSSHVLKNPNLHGDKMLVFETPVVVEVDTETDFELLEFQMSKFNPPVLEFLNRITNEKEGIDGFL